MKRRPLIAGNWKMFKTISEAQSFVEELLQILPKKDLHTDVVIAPPYYALYPLKSMLANSIVQLAAQNVHFETEGAFTGEISPVMLRDVDCSYCIIGHSERRQLFGETDEFVSAKLHALLKLDIIPILCVGETLEEREEGKTEDKVIGQLQAALRNVSRTDALKITVAYEPIWAIGTGRTATPGQAQEIHALLRHNLRELYDEELAEQFRILYGGSVKPDNIGELLSQPDIDGALIGGASLKAKSFAQMVETAKSMALNI
jgi:triosephosphate isomerase